MKGEYRDPEKCGRYTLAEIARIDGVKLADVKAALAREGLLRWNYDLWVPTDKANRSGIAIRTRASQGSGRRKQEFWNIHKTRHVLARQDVQRKDGRILDMNDEYVFATENGREDWWRYPVAEWTQTTEGWKPVAWWVPRSAVETQDPTEEDLAIAQGNPISDLFPRRHG